MLDLVVHHAASSLFLHCNIEAAGRVHASLAVSNHPQQYHHRLLPLFLINFPAFTFCLAAELSVGAPAVSLYTFRLDRLRWCRSRICYCNVARLVVAVSMDFKFNWYIYEKQQGLEL